MGDVRQVAVTYVGGTYLGSALIELSNMAVLLNGPTTGSWKHFCTQPSMTWGGGGGGRGGGRGYFPSRAYTSRRRGSWRLVKDEAIDQHCTARQVMNDVTKTTLWQELTTSWVGARGVFSQT